MEISDKFKCKLCKNAYDYEGTLKTHVMIVHCKSNSHFCNQCEYHKPDVDATQKGELAQAEKEKLHKCNQCDYATVQASHLKRHSRIHSGEKLHKCNQCDYASAHAGELKRHLKTHTGEKITIASSVDTNVLMPAILINI